MSHWNKTGKIKAIILGILFIPNLIFASPLAPNFGISLFIAPLFFGAIAIPLIVKVNSSVGLGEIEKPNWNDNPLKLSRPLVFLQFGAWFFLSTGISTIIGSAIQFKHFQTFGMATIMFGVGILIGIRLTLKWFDK